MNSYVALDLETTGLNPTLERILEIGAVKYTDGRETDRFSTLVNPGREVSERITELTGITNEMAQNGADSREAVRELLDFCGDLPLLGHNILFDYSFVKRAAVNQKLTFEKEGIDTLKIARHLLPELPHRNLDFLCRYYEISQGRIHRAEDDARASAALYLRMREAFPEAEETLFAPKPLIYRVKRQGPITSAQKGYLNDLTKYHKIELSMQIESLTKNEASRLIDKIILEYGKLNREAGGKK